MNTVQRYASQTVLNEVGTDGQERLARARVLVIGAGGLGSPVLLYLNAAGIGQKSHGGKIGIIDDDKVEISNLQRQILFCETDIGQAKVAASAQHLEKRNSSAHIEPINARLQADNALRIFKDYDIIVDGSDNFPTKFLINDAAVKLGLPVVYGAVLGFEGQASVFWAQRGPCYRCLYPHPPVTHVPNCAQYGTLGGIVGAIGAIQSIEVCKLALGLTHCKERGLTPLIGRLWVADARYWDTRNLKVKKNTRCPVCGVPPEDISLTPTPPLLCTKTLVTTLSLTDVEAMRQSGQNVFILDVRESHEWKIKRLPNAHLIPLHTLINDSSSLKSINANQTIAVHCEGGTRSITACEYLIKNGFNACNLIVDWATVNQFM